MLWTTIECGFRDGRFSQDTETMNKPNSDPSKPQSHEYVGLRYLEHIASGPILSPYVETVAPHHILLLLGVKSHIPASAEVANLLSMPQFT